jgi:hypothetical protein
MFSIKISDDLELGLLEQRHAEELFALVDQNREYLREWLYDHYVELVVYGILASERSDSSKVPK